MNENIKKIWQYIWTGIMAHPVQSVVTLLTGIGVVFTIVSNTHVDLFITSQEVKANAQQIQVLDQAELNDHDSILLLQQIAKDEVLAEQNTATQLQQLNNTFQNYLLNKVH